MIGAFLAGARYPFAGLAWIARPRLRRFVLIPLLVNMALFGGAIAWGAGAFERLLDAMLAGLPGWLEWLRWVLWPLFALVVLVIGFYTFTLVANLIGAPFNGLLAERVEALVAPGGQVQGSGVMWRGILLAPLVELRKLLYFAAWAIPILLLFLVPGVNLAAPFLWLAFCAWMLALTYADYPLGNHGLAWREQRAFMARSRALSLGFGAGSLAITLVPVLNFVAMPASVIGATLMWVERLRAHALALEEAP